METKFTVYFPDGTKAERMTDIPRDPGYGLLKTLLKEFIPNHFEHVAVLHDDKRLDMFVDEDGLMKKMPRNEAATEIFRTNWLKKYPKTPPEELSFIVGTAVLFHRRVWY
jgi:hypothetical protein